MTKRAPWLWPLLLIVGGVALLLDNFLLINLDISAYWPVLLVLVGLQLVLRGDVAPTWQSHTFGITRGSVQSASLEIESGELDINLRALRKPGRLIAGQYTGRSRPALVVRNNHATLRMQRGRTWWLSLADWDVGLAQDLPWGLLVSSYLGRIEVDLRGVAVDRLYAASGFGDVNVACPESAPGILYARSSFGNVRCVVPRHSHVRITVQAGPFGRVRVDERRFHSPEPGLYLSRNGLNPSLADGEEQTNDFTIQPDAGDDVVVSTDASTTSEVNRADVDLTIIVGTVFGTVHLS